MKNGTIWSNLIYLSLFFGGKGGGGEEMSARFVTAKVSAALEVVHVSFSRKGKYILSDEESCSALCGFIFQQTRLFNQYPAVHPI